MLAAGQRRQVRFRRGADRMIAALADQRSEVGGHRLAFESFGVGVAVEAGSPEHLERIRASLPPGARETDPDGVEHHFTLVADEFGTYGVTYGEKQICRGYELELALGVIDSQVRITVGLSAPDAIFIHAGVVAVDDRAVVMPGRSFAGKTTLVAALVRRGAVYYSDEFAVVDREGLVHPFAKPLSLREAFVQTDHEVASLGGVAGEAPLPIGAVVVTQFRPDAEWAPRRLTPGQGAMALLANALAAREHPQRVLEMITRSLGGAVVLESDRGEAEETVPLLLAELESATP